MTHYLAPSKTRLVAVLAVLFLALAASPSRCGQPQSQTPSTVEFRILDLPQSGTTSEGIDYRQLPVIPVKHAVISAGTEDWKFRLHSYLVRHDGKFWCMWSHGPVIEDHPTQHVCYAISQDGLTWSEPKILIPPPAKPYAYIARGFWVRDGELLALAANYKGKGAFGVDKELKLEAFTYDKANDKWVFKAVVFDNAINNFPPEKLPSGEWMMSRRDSRFNVYALMGGTKRIDRWKSVDVVDRLKAVRTTKFSPDEPIWWTQPDNSLVALFRDNGGSGRLFRSTSEDEGKSWSTPVRTNFPNATSKLFSLETSTGTRVLISNANHKVGRRELHLSASADGMVFTRMTRLDIPSDKPATLQYPHAVEHDGFLYIAFSRNKTAIEIIRVKIDDLPKPASALPLKPVTCEGAYPHHLQGVCADSTGTLYWSFTTKLVKTDSKGKLLKAIDVANHHGDLCFHDGKVFVAVNLGKFNDPEGNADSWVYVYDADDLALVTKHKTAEVFHGAGGIAYHDSRFLVVGGLPDKAKENLVYEYDRKFKFVKKHALGAGHTLMGIQTAAFAEGHWWFGCYDEPKILLKADAALKKVERFKFDCSLGIVPVGDGDFLVGRDNLTKGKGHTGSLVPARSHEQRGLVLLQDEKK